MVWGLFFEVTIVWPMVALPFKMLKMTFVFHRLSDVSQQMIGVIQHNFLFVLCC